MMILDKKGNLKTLFNLGTEIKDLRKILLQGTLLSVFEELLISFRHYNSAAATAFPVGYDYTYGLSSCFHFRERLIVMGTL
jgi:hypothetical protein